MRTDWEKEQKRILELVDTMKPAEKDRRWTRYDGDVVSRIVALYLGKHLPKHLNIFGPNAYLIGLPTEFDLLIGEAKAKRRRCTNAYRPDQIYSIIEVTSRTTGMKQLKQKVDRSRRDFQSAIKLNPSCKCAFLAMEVSSPAPMKKITYNRETKKFKEEIIPQTRSSIDYAQEICKGLAPFVCFILRNRRNKALRKGEWERLVQFVL